MTNDAERGRAFAQATTTTTRQHMQHSSDRVSSTSSNETEATTTTTASTQDDTRHMLGMRTTTGGGGGGGLKNGSPAGTRQSHRYDEQQDDDGDEDQQHGHHRRGLPPGDLRKGMPTAPGRVKPTKRVAPRPPPPAHTTRHLLILVLFIIGLIVCVTSLLCLLLLPSFVTQQIAKKLVLKNNSMLLERWSKPNVPMYFKVWLYDIKNAQEIIDKRDTKPRVEEIGPFVFNLKRQKDVISFAGENLYYTERKIYHFNRELSCCAINTTVTIPNIPLVAVVDRALSYNLPLVGRFIPRLINRAIQSLREQLFVRKQVREILFDGYDVELLKMVSRVGSLVGLPQQSQKFALLKGRNDTWRPEQDGVWAINTGQRDRRQFGRVSSWNSYKKLPFWPAAQCNVINGSDGTLFPPPIRRTEPLYIFNQELCRTVNLVFDRPSDVRSIQSLRFVLNPMNFAHTMTGSSSGSGSAGASAQQSTGPQAATAQLLLKQALAANQTNGDAARSRINPIFQNRDRGTFAVPGPGPKPSPGEPPLDPLSVLLAAAPALVPPQRVGAQPQQQQNSPVVSNQPAQLPARNAPAPRSRSSPQPPGLATRRVTPPGSGEPRASASETRPATVTSSTLGGRRGPQTPLSVSTTRQPAGGGGGPLVANLLENDNQANSQHPAAKASMEAKIRREQEKLIEAAQEAQLANERKSRMNPQTCFCDRKHTNLNGVNVCEFDGLIDLSKCSKQAQVIFGSMPHFYNSDPRLLRQVVGLKPNASKHTTYLDIEPNTGLVLGGKRRVQLNVIIKHNNEIDGFENINDMLVPIVWFEESAMIPEETAQKFRSMYVDRIKMVNYILFSLLIASIALLAVDARLLLSTRYWHQFKWHLGKQHPQAQREQPKKGPPGQSYGKYKARGLAASAIGHDKLKNCFKQSSSLVPPPHIREHKSMDEITNSMSEHQLSTSPATQTTGSGNPDSPLLRHSQSSFSSEPNSSPNISPPETPEGSPELRKWALHGAGTTTTTVSKQQVVGENTTTRIYLDGAGSATNGARIQPSGLPNTRTPVSNGGDNKSIIQLNGGTKILSAPLHSVGPEASSIGSGATTEKTTT